jgi:hypothetical protein
MVEHQATARSGLARFGFDSDVAHFYPEVIFVTRKSPAKIAASRVNKVAASPRTATVNSANTTKPTATWRGTPMIIEPMNDRPQRKAEETYDSEWDRKFAG